MIKLMNLKQYFVPIKEKKYLDSKYNKKIEIVRFAGSVRLDMGDLTQSGEVIEAIWKNAFNTLVDKREEIKKILVLGLGGGSIVKVIKKKWPKAITVGVEIDEKVIEIAKKDFGLKQDEKIYIVNDDAYSYVFGDKGRYDLVVVDCYLGNQFPKKLESIGFYKKLVTRSKMVLVNRLFWGEYKESSMDFVEKLREVFRVSTKRTPSNLIVKVINLD